MPPDIVLGRHMTEGKKALVIHRQRKRAEGKLRCHSLQGHKGWKSKDYSPCVDRERVEKSTHRAKVCRCGRIWGESVVEIGHL